MTIVRRAIIWVVVVAVVVVWATNKLNDKRHYSNTPGQGALIHRTELPPLDTAKGGPIPLPAGDGHQAATHYPAQPAAVQPPIAAPPPVTDRAPANTPQDQQLTPRPGIGSSGGQPTSSTPLNLPSLTDLLPTCDVACITRVLTSLGGGTLGPITVPRVTLPVTVPVVPTP